MQTVIGRLTADATLKQLADGRTVVQFNVAENNRFKTKSQQQYQEVTNYYRCSYWMGKGVVMLLTKGILVEVAGRIGLQVYNNPSGQAKGQLTLHVHFLKIQDNIKKGKTDSPAKGIESPTEAVKSPVDLPF